MKFLNQDVRRDYSKSDNQQQQRVRFLFSFFCQATLLLTFKSYGHFILIYSYCCDDRIDR